MVQKFLKLFSSNCTASRPGIKVRSINYDVTQWRFFSQLLSDPDMWSGLLPDFPSGWSISLSDFCSIAASSFSSDGPFQTARDESIGHTNSHLRGSRQRAQLQLCGSGIWLQRFDSQLCVLQVEPACVALGKLDSPKMPPEEGTSRPLLSNAVGKSQVQV